MDFLIETLASLGLFFVCLLIVFIVFKAKDWLAYIDSHH